MCKADHRMSEYPPADRKIQKDQRRERPENAKNVQDKMQSLEELFMYHLTLKIVSMGKCTSSQMRRSCSVCTWLPPFLLLRAGQITVCLFVPDWKTPTNRSERLLRGQERNALLVGLRLKFVQSRRYLGCSILQTSRGGWGVIFQATSLPPYLPSFPANVYN